MKVTPSHKSLYLSAASSPTLTPVYSPSKIPKSNTGHLAMYMNSDVFAGLNVTAKRCNADVIAINTKSNEFGVQNAWGSYMGVPMRQCDQIVNTETLVK